MTFFFTGASDFSGVLAIADAATVSRSVGVASLGAWIRVKSTNNILLQGLSHTFADDLDFLLVGPDGTNLAFWSDVGGTASIPGRTFSIADSYASTLPDAGGTPLAEYRPANYGEFEASSNWSGAPPGLVVNHPTPYGTATVSTSFTGKWVENSTWSLFVRDDTPTNSGSLDRWSLSWTVDVICKPHDFNGVEVGSTSDILWQRNDGTPAIWLMDGFTLLNVGVGANPGPSWHVRGDADFNDDGRSDILWQNDDGTPVIWLMNGLSLTAAGPVGVNPGPAWHIKGTGDFNFDGKADILWQHDDGRAGIWLMNGLTALAQAPVGVNPGPAWQIKGAADFNNDGKADILWQHTDGRAGIWLMDGLNVPAANPVGTNPGSAWQIKGTGDFNNDGRADILWQNADGNAGIWLMNGLDVLAGNPVGMNPGTSWHIIGSGDYDGDQKSDILWQHDSGQAGIWTMNGMSTIVAAPTGPSPGSDWHIIA